MGNFVNICINGDSKVIEAGSTLSDAVELVNLRGPFAVTVNNVLVTKADYEQCVLNDGDAIEIVHPMQGG